MMPLGEKGKCRGIIRLVLHPEFGLEGRRGNRLGHLLVELNAPDARSLQHVLEQGQFGTVG
jgi:hypothetical protein